MGIADGWRPIADLRRTPHKEEYDIAVVATPAESTAAVVKQVVRAGIKAILNFAPVQISVPPDVTVSDGEHGDGVGGLSFALSNRSD